MAIKIVCYPPSSPEIAPCDVFFLSNLQSFEYIPKEEREYEKLSG